VNAGGSGEPTAGGGAASGGTGGGGSGGASGEAKSGGCGKPRTLQDGSRMVQSGGAQRTYKLRAPSNYDSNHPYRLMLDFHGAKGSSNDIAPSYFGLWDLAENSTIFAALDAVDGLWQADADTAFVGDLLKELKDQLCVDTTRIGLEGFSQGGAMTWTLACAIPDTFRFAVVHSGGGLAMPKTCQPIPFLSSLGHDGNGQGMSSDFFATTNGCTVQTLPPAPTGGHACTNYSGCSPGHPTRWCAYDGGHTSAPTDAGQGESWMPQEVWSFVKQF
jgi:poly(3-hydroxybutyrate) depolymerase